MMKVDVPAQEAARSLLQLISAQVGPYDGAPLRRRQMRTAY